MEFKLLGNLEVALDGRAPALPARARERCLLAALLMNAGKTLSTGNLMRCAWDDEDPPEATFRSYLAHVRDFLVRLDAGVRVARAEGGYRLLLDPDHVDLYRFRRLQDQAASAVRAGNASQAVALLCEAEALWRGPALDGLTGRWVEAMRDSLEEERLACVKKRAGLELDLGHHAELAAELRLLSAQNPLDEVFIRYEMTALFRSGRQADALAAYRQARERSISQGLTLGPEVVALQQRILRRDLEPPRAASRPRPATAERPATVPAPAGAFVGRGAEIATLTSAAPEGAWVAVITGMPGVGKSRLAVEAALRLADRYPDGQFLLEFHAHQAGAAPLGTDGALRRLLEMAGGRLPPVPHNQREPSALWRNELIALWQGELEAARMIVILDDVPDAATIAPLLPRAGSSAVIVTTRQQLPAMEGAQQVTLHELAEPDAIRLFTMTAGPGGADDEHAVARLVRSLGCLPLAVTLAASRLREDGGPSTATDLVADISEADIFPAVAGLGGGQLASALEASYQALPEDLRRLFRLLGGSPAMTFTTESTAAVAGVPATRAEEMTRALLDRHLAERTTGSSVRMHDLLRNFAASCARRDSPSQERRDAERRLLDHYLRVAGQATRRLYSHPQGAAASPEAPGEWLEAEWRNMIKAADYAARHEWLSYCVEIAGLLAEFLDMRGCWDDAQGLHTLAVRAGRDLGDQRLVARALVDLSRACQRKGMHQLALEHAQQALEASQAADDPHGAALAADRLGVTCYYMGRFRDALAHKQEARVLYAEAGDPAGEAEAIFHCGVSSLHLGRLSDSLRHFHEALSFFRQAGNRHWAAKALNSIAEISRMQGHHREAVEDYNEALTTYRAMGARPELATVLLNIGKVHLYKGNPERALPEFRCALATSREIRDLPGQARALCDLGDAYQATSDYSQCLVYYQQGAAIAEEIDDLSVRTVALCGSGDAHRLSDCPEEAMRYYSDALKIVQETSEPYMHARILDGMAQTMLRIGRHTMGRVYLRQALDLYKAAGAVEAGDAQIRLEALGSLPGGA